MANIIENTPDFFVPTTCLFCGQAEDRILYPAHLNANSFTGYTYSARRKRQREHYQLVRCATCGLVRSNPILSENRFNTLYAESQFIFSEEAPYAARTYIHLLQQLREKYHARIGSLLEIGCSTGFFLDEALSRGISEVIGFEPSLDCYRHAKAHLQPRIINDVYKPELLHEQTFDLAGLFHVIDHLQNPKEILQSVACALNPGGYVMLVCHDVESWSAKLLDGYSPIFDVEHIYLFSRNTLQKLLEVAGFTCLEVGSLANTYPLGYWIRMLPLLNRLTSVFPRFLRNRPVTFHPGNLYIFAQKGQDA